MTHLYRPLYRKPGETPLKSYYTFIGAGVYTIPTTPNTGAMVYSTHVQKDMVVFRWDNESAWKAILYRHLYTTEQRDQLYSYVHLAKHINDNCIDPNVKKDFKNGEFVIDGVRYCVRNMYIYPALTVDKWIRICAVHFKKDYADTLAEAIAVLCKNGGHSCLDILKIIDYVVNYTLIGTSAIDGDPANSRSNIAYVYVVNGYTYTLPEKYPAACGVLDKYFGIKPTRLGVVNPENLALEYAAGCININGIANPTGTCMAISVLHMLSDMDILVQECDAYDTSEDSMMYMFKTFQEFRRDRIKWGDVHRNYGKLYHTIDRFLSEEWTLLRWFSPPRPYEPKKVMEVALDLPTRSCWGAIQIPIIKLIDGLVAQLKYPMNMIFADCEDAKCETRPFIYDIEPGTEAEWVQHTDSSHKYVILHRVINPAWRMLFTCFTAANIPIRVYNKHTDSDYVLVSYLMHIPRGVYWHMVYVNMETRTRVCNQCIDDGPSSMHTYTTDDIGCVGSFSNEPEYTPQSLAHACMLLYRLDDGPSQVQSPAVSVSP